MMDNIMTSSSKIVVEVLDLPNSRADYWEDS